MGRTAIDLQLNGPRQVVVERNWVHLGMGSFLKDPIQVDPAHTDHVVVRGNTHDA